MSNLETDIGELIYSADIRFTGVVEYGVHMDALTTGQEPIPPAGARFDQTFQGTLHGPKIKGLIEGTDFLYVRPDGTFHLHLHGKITTEDGVNIALFSDGVSLQQENTHEALLRSTVSLFTLSEPYQWLNRLQLWAMGTLDPQKGEASIRAYSA